MTNTTETYWEVDGVSLQTYAFNIESLGGDREAPPSVRGDDIVIPYAPGSRWQPKVPDTRTISLGMWVVGAEEDGSIPTSESQRRQFERNWRMLRRLLWTPRRQFVLTKRFWVLEDDLVEAGVDPSALPQSGEWRLYTASAKGTFAGGLNPDMNGQTRARFTVDIRLNDVYFFGPEVSVDFAMDDTEQEVVVLGDDRTYAIEVDFEGPLTSPRIANDQLADLWVQYGTVVDDGENATVRVRPFSATHYPTGEPFKSSGYVQHSGDRFWLFLDPGTATLTLSAQDGTGVATLRYQPAWM